MTTHATSAPPARPATAPTDPARLGGSWPDRHSFARTMLRRASTAGWRVRRVHVEVDASGVGTAEYRVTAEGRVFTFLATTRTIDAALRTDRVIAAAWDLSAVLVEDVPTDAERAHLYAEIPRQEAAVLPDTALVLTRANRSGRFFDALVDELAHGRRPDLASLGPCPYLVRSTAFYANGRFGLRPFDGLGTEHPLGAPYRAQMLTAWLLRELGFELADIAARHRARSLGTVAVPLDDDVAERIGIGNATGLGMVPVVVAHPELLDAWTTSRTAPYDALLARALSPQDPELAALDALLHEADGFLDLEADLATAPFPGAGELQEGVRALRARLDRVRSGDEPATTVLADLDAEAAARSETLRGLVRALVLELHPELDAEVEALLLPRTPGRFDPAESCGRLRDDLTARYGWALDLDFTDPDTTRNAWVSSVVNEEPRRIARAELPAGAHEHTSDVARRLRALADALAEADPDAPIAALLAERPHLRSAAERVAATRTLPNGELHDNLLGADHLPLDAQRFQLALYGMHHFSPRSTDWLRVALLCGAPRVTALDRGLPLDAPVLPRTRDLGVTP